MLVCMSVCMYAYMYKRLGHLSYSGYFLAKVARSLGAGPPSGGTATRCPGTSRASQAGQVSNQETSCVTISRKKIPQGL